MHQDIRTRKQGTNAMQTIERMGKDIQYIMDAYTVVRLSWEFIALAKTVVRQRDRMPMHPARGARRGFCFPAYVVPVNAAVGKGGDGHGH
jgi:hypothetical protein